MKSTDNLSINTHDGEMSVHYEKENIDLFLEFSYVEGVEDGSTYNLYTHSSGKQVAMWTDSAVSNRLVMWSFGDTQAKYDLSEKDAKVLTKAIESFFNLPT